MSLHFYTRAIHNDKVTESKTDSIPRLTSSSKCQMSVSLSVIFHNENAGNPSKNYLQSIF